MFYFDFRASLKTIMFIPIQAIPYIRLAKRLFAGRGSLDAVAYHRDILCPAETQKLRPAIFLPGQLERVAELVPDRWFHTTKESEIAQALMTTTARAPTIAYHIKNAVLFDGSIYVGYFRHPVAERSLFASSKREVIHLATGALTSSYLGTKFFGHWLADDCTTYLLAEGIGRPVCVRTAAYGHKKSYQRYFNQDWTPVDRARIDHLVVHQDYSQNSHKRNRYRILRDRLIAHLPLNKAKPLVYLRRGTTGALRVIQNEEEIIDALTKNGFVVVDIASDSLEHIVQNLLHARIVVSLEGSHVAHCTVACPENSGLLKLQPADRFSAVHRDWADSLGVRFGFVVGHATDAGYYFSVPEISATIEILLNAIANSPQAN